MRLRVATGGQTKRLLLGGETRHLHADPILTQRNTLEIKFPGGVAGGRLCPVGGGRAQADRRTLHGTMLRIMNQSMNRAKNCGAGSEREQEQGRGKRCQNQISSHKSPMICLKSMSESSETG